MRAAVAVVLGLTVALPAVPLVDRWAEEGSRPVSERPASFQMYSATGRPVYRAEPGGRVLDTDALPPVLRAVGSGPTVPDLLCDREPGLTAVVREGGPDPGRFPC